MFRFLPLRFCAYFSNESSQMLQEQQIPTKRGQFLNTISQLDSLHTVLMRREGSPDELKRQAKFILGDEAFTKLMMYEEPSVIPTNHVGAFATQVAALSSMQDPPHPQFFKRLGKILEHHLHVVQQDLVSGKLSNHSSTMMAFSSSSSSNLSGKPSPLASLHQQRRLGGHQQHFQNLLHPNDYSKGQDVLLEMKPQSSSSSQNSIKNHHDEGDEHSSSVSHARTISAVMECIVSLCGDGRNVKTLPPELSSCLQVCQSLALHLLTSESNVPITLTSSSSTSGSGGGHQHDFYFSNHHGKVECTPRHLLAFLRCADLCLGGPSSFHFTRKGVPPLVMLPVKSKHDMERKAQKFPVFHELLRELERRIPLLTRIDAHVCLRQFAVIGLFNKNIIDACLERIVMGLAITPHQQAVEVVVHLGVLGYRHVCVREIVDAINVKNIGARGLRSLLRGMAMLQLPWKSVGEVRDFQDLAWLLALRPQNEKNASAMIAWHIDVAHAFAALGSTHYKFLLRTCRLVRNEMRTNAADFSLQTIQQAQLLWSIGKVDRKSVPSELDRDWVKQVNRVKNSLVREVMDRVANLISVDEGDLSGEVDQNDREYHQHLHNCSSSISLNLMKTPGKDHHHHDNDMSDIIPLLFQGLEACGIHTADVLAHSKKMHQSKEGERNTMMEEGKNVEKK